MADWEGLVLAGLALGKRESAVQWEWGDLALQVETRHGEASLAAFAEEVGIAYQTLRDHRRVAAAFAKDARASNLSFRHHQAIASRPDRLEWLAKAAEQRWSVRVMQAAIAEADGQEARIEIPMIGDETSMEEGTAVMRQAMAVVNEHEVAGGNDATELMERFNPPGFDADENRRWMLARATLLESLRNIAHLPDPVELEATFSEARTVEFEEFETVIHWLHRFFQAWRLRYAHDRDS